MTASVDDDQIARFLTVLEQRAPRPLTIVELARALHLDRYDRRLLQAGLEAQVAARRLRRIGKTRYQWVREVDRPTAPARAKASAARKQAPRVEGRYARVQAGFGFVAVTGPAAERYPRDILIPRGSEGAAMHGDRVTVEIMRRDGRNQRVAGRVVAVTRAEPRQLIGSLQRTRQGWCLVPHVDLLPPVLLRGDVVPRRQDEGLVGLVRVTEPPAPGQWPAGELVRVLGSFEDPEVQFLTVALAHDLRIEFPPDVRAEATRLPADPPEADLAGRRDLRAQPFVTIDGETARDFDDAVCVEDDGRTTRLWVAIADVSHYVRPRSALDAEAALRGTSVYFPDRAVPMLPHELSTTLCSLNPGRPRLVLVAELTYDDHGRRTSADFYRGVIQSRARLTYTQVAAVLSDADTSQIRAWREELGTLVPQLARMRALMLLLYRNRVAAGSLDLDLPEAMVDLSEEGRSVGIRLLQRNDAHRLIEELMLEANRAVAVFLGERDVPIPYRIHEAPRPADVDDLNELLGVFGLHLAYRDEVRPADVQRLLRRLDGHPLARVLSRQVLRALAKAQYDTTNAGHFGLAFADYCHFTSPIRRYPDLLVHRQLGRVFDDDLATAHASAAALEHASVESSRAERSAMEAERAMLDVKKAEFMLGHLLEPGPATIVGVAKSGFFVELDAYPVEGLVRSDTLTDDAYRFDERQRALVGLRGRRPYRLGDRVVVEATDASLERGQVDFRVLERIGSPARTRAKRPVPTERPRKTPRQKRGTQPRDERRTSRRTKRR